MPNDEPTPILRTLFEQLAEVLEIDAGNWRLELEFSDGSIRRWYVRGGPRGADDLARYDGRAAWLRAETTGT